MSCSDPRFRLPLVDLRLNRDRLLRLLTSAPKAFWRADCDFSLAAAERLARFAHVAGVSVTFYLAARSTEYNVFSDEGQRAVDLILSLGHRLGAHVDERHGLGDPEYAVETDLMLWDACYPGLLEKRPNETPVSFHMPSPDVLWKDWAWFSSAYASEWEGRYVSDSRNEWGDEKESRVNDDAQVCVHPEWWFGA